MRVSNLVEDIFSQAVALSQDGGFRNTIYALDKEIFILNYDHTLLLRFLLRPTEATFAHPIGFNANDYDSNEFDEVDGKIVFTSRQGEFMRKKTCGVPGITPDEVRQLYANYTNGDISGERLELSSKVLSLLDMELSHVEFSGEEGGGLLMVQRNIYDGTIIEVTQQDGGLFSRKLSAPFGPVAIKTSDFAALYRFQDTLNFTFPHRESDDYIVATSVDRNRRDMTAVVACCLYDEIIDIRQSK